MNRITRVWLPGIAAAIFARAPASSRATQPHPLAIPLKCALGNCSVLTGAPNCRHARRICASHAGRNGRWHTTGKNEEAQVILHGMGEALIDGQPGLPFVAPALVYIPPATRHNFKNTGGDPLEYEHVVASANAK